MPCVKIIGKHKHKIKVNESTKTVKCLVDHGSSSSLVTSDCVPDNKTHTGVSTQWKTTAGALTTKKQAVMNFQLNELSETALVHHKFNVHNGYLGQCDMIIGRDLSSHMGSDVCGSNPTMRWPSKGAEAPFESSGLGREETYFIGDPKSLEGETDRMSRILDAEHSKADLHQMAKNVKTLSGDEQKNLEKVLKASVSSFDGTLGGWEGDPREIKLKDNVQPYHAKPFSVPHAREKTLRMEVDRLCSVGVLKKVNGSQWASPSFTMPKKDDTVRSIDDFRELNERAQRTPHPIPKMQDMLLELKGFTCATSFDLDAGYCHVELCCCCTLFPQTSAHCFAHFCTI